LFLNVPFHVVLRLSFGASDVEIADQTVFIVSEGDFSQKLVMAHSEKCVAKSVLLIIIDDFSSVSEFHSLFSLHLQSNRIHVSFYCYVRVS
jgi:hypothetical protein